MAKREMASLRITLSAVPVTAVNHEMRLLSGCPSCALGDMAGVALDQRGVGHFIWPAT
jgi:hypothetical protein